MSDLHLLILQVSLQVSVNGYTTIHYPTGTHHIYTSAYLAWVVQEKWDAQDKQA